MVFEQGCVIFLLRGCVILCVERLHDLCVERLRDFSHSLRLPDLFFWRFCGDIT